MIREFDQPKRGEKAGARQVQERRIAAGKSGYAKAVRRFLRRVAGTQYRQARAQLPVRWVEKANSESVTD